MSKYLDRAARVSTDFAPADQCAHHGGCDCVHQHAALRIGTRFLRAYQDLREWTVDELEALPEGSVLVDRSESARTRTTGGWQCGADLLRSRLLARWEMRLVYNPNDLKED